jgi:hypothetical protein
MIHVVWPIALERRTREKDMGIFKGFFGGKSGAEDEGSATTTVTCVSCGTEVDYDEIEEGECEDCYNSPFTGTRYCCGAIYEEGEDTCMSCGEPI